MQVLVFLMLIASLALTSSVSSEEVWIAESDEGIAISTEGASIRTVMERLMRGVDAYSVQVHPDLHKHELSLNHRAGSWADLLSALLFEIGAEYRVEAGILYVASAETIRDSSWRDLELAARTTNQILADLDVSIGGSSGSFDDLILADGNWIGVSVDDYVLNINARLLSASQVQFSFMVTAAPAEGPRSKSVASLITTYGAEAWIRQGDKSIQGEVVVLELAITPKRCDRCGGVLPRGG